MNSWAQATVDSIRFRIAFPLQIAEVTPPRPADRRDKYRGRLVGAENTALPGQEISGLERHDSLVVARLYGSNDILEFDEPWAIRGVLIEP